MNKPVAKILVPILFTLAGLNAGTQAAGQSIDNDELIKYAVEAAQGRASEQQKAILFACNERLNNLAMAGKISNSTYQINQKAFVAQNDELIRLASSRHGLSVAQPEQTQPYRAGTDTDRQLQSRADDLTFNDVKNVRSSYNQEVANYLKSQGVKVSPNENWSKKLATDIMPAPDNMKVEDFRRATRYINSDGGLAYNDIEAAKLQLRIGSGELVTPSLHEAGAYHQEMQKKIKLMNDQINDLNRQRATVSDPAELENLDVEIRKRTAFMSKYIARDNDVSDLISKGSSEGGLVESSYTRKAAARIKTAQTRDAAGATINAEAHVGALNQHLADSATRRFNDAIAGAAVANGNIDGAKSIIAGNLKSLSPKQQSQAIEDLEIKYGDKLARSVSAELKKGAPGVAGGRKVSVSSGLGLVNTVLTVGNQYAEGKTTTEILWNMSIGATLENVHNETADYTAREIERLKQEYRDAGEDPESTSVKLKIMAEATVKGTFHGSVIGSYDLLKSATNTAAGAAVSVADSAIFLVGEALDTKNVLETTYAEMQAQNMEQSVQNAKAAKFGKDALAELKRLSAQAAHLRSLLEQNTRSARLFCRACDNALDDLRADLREINAFSGSEGLKNLPQAEKKLMKSLTACSQEVKKLIGRAETARRALAGGGDFKEALLAVQVINFGYNSQSEVLEKCHTEMLAVGEQASQGGFIEMLAGFETAKAQLLEQSRMAAANAEIMRKNEEQFKKTIAAFDALKERVLKAETFFADKRQANEGDWMVIKSRLREIARPDSTMPGAFFGEVGTLERLPDNIRSEAGRLQPVAESAAAAGSENGNPANDALERLTPAYNDAARALATLKEAIDALRAAAGSQPEKPAPSTVALSCPSTVVCGETVTVRVALPASNSRGSGSTGKVDPFGGHDPDSVEGMMALAEYKRAHEAGRLPQAGNAGKAEGFLVSWDFGDGTISGKSSDSSIGHVYRQPGNYTLKVRVYEAGSPDQVVAENSARIRVEPQAEKPAPPRAEQPKQGDGRLPCGHLPGECPKDGIMSLKCRLHSGSISNKKN